MHGERKLKIWKPVVLGFTMLYLFIMVLSTWVMELRFAEEFKKSAAQHLSSIRQQLENSPGDVRLFRKGQPKTAGKGWRVPQTLPGR